MLKVFPVKDTIKVALTFDTIESLGIKLAKSVFNTPFANIQSTSGTVSNIAALKALSKPGDKITAVSTADGGHISHARMGAVGLRDSESINISLERRQNGARYRWGLFIDS